MYIHAIQSINIIKQQQERVYYMKFRNNIITKQKDMPSYYKFFSVSIDLNLEMGQSYSAWIFKVIGGLLRLKHIYTHA